jgi:aminocarboxymuconate-semialdehyde decarboxylase
LNTPAAEDFFALADAAGAPVLLHPPAQPVEAGAFGGHLGLIEHVARPCDISCGVAAILFAGWLERYPNLKLIAPNAGGALALLAEKLELAQRRARPPATRRPAGISHPALRSGSCCRGSTSIPLRRAGWHWPRPARSSVPIT